MSALAPAFAYLGAGSTRAIDSYFPTMLLQFLQQSAAEALAYRAQAQPQAGLSRPERSDATVVATELDKPDAPVASLETPVTRMGSIHGPILNAPGHWDVYISYTEHNGHAVRLAEAMFAALQTAGLSVWFDVKMSSSTSTAAMEEGVENAKCVLAIVTGSCTNDTRPDSTAEDNAYFAQEQCQMELRRAKDAGIRIQPLVRIEDKQQIGVFLSLAPPDLRELGSIDFIELVRSDPDYWDAGVDKVLAVVRDAPASFNLPGHWDAFISYTQRNGNAAMLAEKVAADLRNAGLSVWLDVSMASRSTAAMKEGIENAKCVLAIVTGPGINNDRPSDDAKGNAYFAREYCQMELRWAKDAGTRIQPLVRVEDKQQIATFLSQAPADLQCLEPSGFIELIRSDATYWNAGIAKIADVVDGTPARGRPSRALGALTTDGVSHQVHEHAFCWTSLPGFLLVVNSPHVPCARQQGDLHSHCSSLLPSGTVPHSGRARATRRVRARLVHRGSVHAEQAGPSKARRAGCAAAVQDWCSVLAVRQRRSVREE